MITPYYQYRSHHRACSPNSLDNARNTIHVTYAKIDVSKTEIQTAIQQPKEIKVPNKDSEHYDLFRDEESFHQHRSLQK